MAFMVHRGDIFHAINRLKKLKMNKRALEVPQHVSAYNIFMKIEANEHNIKGLMKVFSDMKRVKVEPNEISYCIVATAHAVARLYTIAEAYVEGVEKSITGNNWSTLDILIMLYGYLGKEKGLEKTWQVVQDLPYVRSKSYVLAIVAFGIIGKLD
ncbi:Pentatricopeptide repeat [Parasponia andersonii]|uniref:Pentatricopeptide repeat n=1 Tax=Parasponia andersonii TaxID=3476 RepID=A0A2P5AAG3_PARAD|nr:Pentatricopeptide repeat [Parasponia andersonii]